jgi:hypothetical protein
MRLWPRPAEVGEMLSGIVKQPSLVRFRRIQREVTILRRRVEESRQGLARAGAVPPEVRQLADDVGRHLAAEPPTARNRPPAWVEETRQLLSRARRQTDAVFRAPHWPEVRPLLEFLADVEDLYELGLLKRRGIVGGLGRRHGWRLEWLLRAAEGRNA